MDIIQKLKEYNILYDNGKLNPNAVRLVKKYSDIYAELLSKTSFLPKDVEIKERLLCVINDIKELQFCPECNTRLKLKLAGPICYQEFCSVRCAGKSLKVRNKRKKTMIERYGVEYTAQSDELKRKMKATCIERYGVDNPFELIENVKKGVKKKYGVDNVMKVDKIKEKHKIACQQKNFSIINDKIKEIKLKKYGSLNAKSCIDKAKITSLSKYGCEHWTQKHISHDALHNLKNKQWLLKEHHTNKKTLTQISQQLKVSDVVVGNYCRKHHIEIIRYPSSLGEQEIVNMLEENNIELITCSRSIISPYELDIYVKEYNLAIEYCGLFWHSERAGKNKQYHKRKYDLCKERGIQLITIFEDEWKEKQEQIKSKLLSLLKVDPRDRIYARKTNIEIISKIDKTKFFNENHIQGNGPSSINIGLMYEGEIVACMGFIQYKDKTYLNRYATSSHVIGGFSKLLKYFKTIYEWKTLISFADLRWSDGNLYKKTGWELDKILPPDYYYSLDGIFRYHKFNFRRKHLPKLLDDFDPNVSEKSNCDNNGVLRIWDCGKQRWVMNNK